MHKIDCGEGAQEVFYRGVYISMRNMRVIKKARRALRAGQDSKKNISSGAEPLCVRHLTKERFCIVEFCK